MYVFFLLLLVLLFFTLSSISILASRFSLFQLASVTGVSHLRVLATFVFSSYFPLFALSFTICLFPEDRPSWLFLLLFSPSQFDNPFSSDLAFLSLPLADERRDKKRRKIERRVAAVEKESASAWCSCNLFQLVLFLHWRDVWERQRRKMPLVVLVQFLSTLYVFTFVFWVVKQSLLSV